MLGAALLTGFLAAGAVAWWTPAEPYPVNDGQSADDLVAAAVERLPDDPRAEEGRVRAILAEIRADIDADRLEAATNTIRTLVARLAAKPVPSLAADCTAVLNELVDGWVRRMMRCSKEGRLDEMLVAYEILTTLRSERAEPLSSLVLDIREFDDRRFRIIPFREAWLTFAWGCVSRLDREGLRTAVRHLRNDGGLEGSLWLRFAEECMFRGDRVAADDALHIAQSKGVPPERIAALAEPDGAAIRMRRAVRMLRDGAIEDAVAAAIEAVALDCGKALATLQDLDAIPLQAAILDACRARFDRAAADEDWAAAIEADTLAGRLAPGSRSWLLGLTEERLRTLGPEFVISLPVNVLAALPASMIENVAPLRNSIGMEFVLVPGGTSFMDHGVDSSDLPIHVTITQPFAIGLAPVTNSQWKRVMGTAAADDSSDAATVAMVASLLRRPLADFAVDTPARAPSWAEAVDFCRRLTELPEERAAGRVYRPPWEGEWVRGFQTVLWRRPGRPLDEGSHPGDVGTDPPGGIEPFDDELGVVTSGVRMVTGGDEVQRREMMCSRWIGPSVQPSGRWIIDPLEPLPPLALPVTRSQPRSSFDAWNGWVHRRAGSLQASAWTPFRVVMVMHMPSGR
jgi:formylglycine-generating enzyme required for sulfatase activity